MTFKHKPHRSADAWLVVADRARARIFSIPPADEIVLEEVESLEYQDGSAHARDLTSDRKGFFKGRSGVLDTGDEQTDLRRVTTDRFAHKIVQQLEAGRKHQKFGHLVLIAAPGFLGALRKQLGGPLSQLVDQTIAKDYTSYSVEELTRSLAQPS
jgi:protein required for attachment to host cells